MEQRFYLMIIAGILFLAWFSLVVLLNRQKALLEQLVAQVNKRLGVLEKHYNDLQKEISSIKEGLAPVTQTLKEIREIKGNMTRIGVSQDDAPYRQAEWLVAKGADAKQVAKETGLSYAEAQLLARLKGQAPLQSKLDSEVPSER
jgi:cell division protein FtsB